MRSRLDQLSKVSNYFAFMNEPIPCSAKTFSEDLRGLLANSRRWGYITKAINCKVDGRKVIYTLIKMGYRYN